MKIHARSTQILCGWGNNKEQKPHIIRLIIFLALRRISPHDIFISPSRQNVFNPVHSFHILQRKALPFNLRSGMLPYSHFYQIWPIHKTKYK